MTFVFPSVNGTVKPKERSGHVAVHYDGYIVVWGGYNRNEPEQAFPGVYFLTDDYNPNEEVWLFCIETSRWYCIETSGEVPPPTSGSSACVVGNSMYIFAGHRNDGPSSTVYVLNLRTFKWKDLTNQIKGNPPSERDKLSCWTHHDSIVYFGGYGTAPDPTAVDQFNGYFTLNTNSEEEYLPATRGWNNHLYLLDTNDLTWSQPKTKGTAPTPRAAQAAAKLGNVAYIFGGRHMEQRWNDLHSLNLDFFEWSDRISTTGSVPQGRTWHTLSAVSDRHLFLYGGFSNEEDALGDSYILDTSTMMWFQLQVPSFQSVPMTRMWHTACRTTVPGEVVIYGGCTSSVLGEEPGHTSSVLIFRFTPQPLNRLCADAVVKYYSSLQKQLATLPKNILKSLFLHRRLQAIDRR
ncbi:kelch domain-containing protein 2-like isoform X1 [Montipora capricornis]|uniref:kelch domain-containing protein 2-like isoform X1 n=1 Tax=Montipora capricornis TaxID=246305 RepID=UPI0035F1924F